ncbi:BlaI/MecI/CopY family transcriptional regulator [Haladaptatus sp. F3-133]|uniref:BlaI/MecI/CopY family transcriptional regulator n=1 Tax=Halorutilus salinus TaxID=2487751 RepID=A0A9Q4C1V5_9EURY|nr:BlaI/MecI/CopY family transcriptional regulator [Halorutilus salinus]MCX2817783.1 BlaI/MecI/CopY family transcriptional regulator [Halorutilus salinus]
MLGSLETEVVSVLEDVEEATIGGVVEELDERGVDVAYTTVSTVLDRLYDKEMVDREKEPYRGGSRYVYEYVDIRDEYLSSVVDNLTTVFGEKGAASLVNEVEEMEDEDLADVKDELGM